MAKLKISDHALLRYMERVQGRDIEKIKKRMIDTIDKKRKGRTTGFVTLPGKCFAVINNNIVITINKKVRKK